MHKALSLLFLICCHTASGDTNTPWFTGPLLAEPAATIEPGKVNIELFNFNFDSNAVYDNQTQVTPVSPSISHQIISQITIGLASGLDLELQPTLISNYFQNKRMTSLGDTSVILGIQALKQHTNTSTPDLRVALSEVLPSGHYENLSQENYALNATGIGSYQTGLDFNFQKLIPLKQDYYLNAHWSFGYLYASAVHIKGYSSYGGTALTNGDVKPGSAYTLDLAGELSVSQHWAIVLEGFYQHQDADRFFGDYGNLDLNSPRKTRTEIKKALSRLMPTKRNISSLFLELPKIGDSTMNMISLAPALEYNFSSKLGIIMGYWFSFYGKNTIDFRSFSIGLNMFL